MVEVRSKAKSKWRPQALDTVVRSGWELVGGVVPAPRSPGFRGGHRLLLLKVPRGICHPGAAQEGKQTPEQDVLEQLINMS